LERWKWSMASFLVKLDIAPVWPHRVLELWHLSLVVLTDEGSPSVIIRQGIDDILVEKSQSIYFLSTYNMRQWSYNCQHVNLYAIANGR
jgi:hypothetical protein